MKGLTLFIMFIMLISVLGTVAAGGTMPTAADSNIFKIPVNIPEPVPINASNKTCTIKTNSGVYTGTLIDLNIQRGWNMIGYPGKLGGATSVDTYCEDICGYCNVHSYPHFKFEHSYYLPESDPKFNTGYMMFNVGSITNETDWYCCVEGNSPIPIHLEKGWNMITNPCCEEHKIKDILGTGIVAGDIGYWYNPSSMSYETSSEAVPGKAYWVKSTENTTVLVDCHSLREPETVEVEYDMIKDYLEDIALSVTECPVSAPVKTMFPQSGFYICSKGPLYGPNQVDDFIYIWKGIQYGWNDRALQCRPPLKTIMSNGNPKVDYAVCGKSGVTGEDVMKAIDDWTQRGYIPGEGVGGNGVVMGVSSCASCCNYVGWTHCCDGSCSGQCDDCIQNEPQPLDQIVNNIKS